MFAVVPSQSGEVQHYHRREGLMRRVLVTGGAGFIGSHLVWALIKHGYDVTVLDDLSTGTAEAVSPAAQLVQGSILDRKNLGDLISRADACIHLAAVASVAQCNQRIAASHKVNLTGFVNIIDALAEGGRTDFGLVYASSAAVYGGSQALPLAEAAVARPLSPYGADKYGCELHAAAAWQVAGISSIGLRFFNVYGPGQDPSSPYSGVISLFADRLSRGEPINLHGDGQQTRDFIYVKDVVKALIAALEAQLDGARVYNVCTGFQTSIYQLAEAIADVYAVPLTIVTSAPREGDVRHSLGDPTALNSSLGVVAKTSLTDGLRALKKFHV